MSCSRRSLICLVLGVISVFLSMKTAAVKVNPQRCEATYKTSRVIYRKTCHDCGWWIFRSWKRCCPTKAIQIYETRTKKICCAGYIGTNCDVPVCSPPCQNKGICVAKNRCDCPSGYQGSTCTSKKCNFDLDCYPGMCRSANCICSSEFDGNNCQTMKEGPIFPTCVGSLIDNASNKVLMSANCNPPRTDENNLVKTYTNQRNFGYIGFEFSASYRKLQDFPLPRPSYMRNFRVGVSEAKGEILLRNTVGNEIFANSVKCSGTASPSTPFETILCNQTLAFLRGVSHNQELEVIMSGTTAGYKEIRNLDTSGSYVTKSISGQSNSVKVIYRFDLKPPVHCTEDHVCEHPNTRPIVLDSDIKHVPTVHLTFFGWDDEDSGLFGFRYNVYRMGPNAQGILQNHSTPIITKEYNLLEENFAYSSFVLPEPGLFSVHGEVLDFANNSRFVRAFVLYSDENSDIEPTKEPLSVTPGPGKDVIDKAYWLNDVTQDITVSWEGCYQSKFVEENKLSARIAPILHHPDYIEYKDGNISTEGTPNLNGISSFQYAIVHKVQLDITRTKRALDIPDRWTSIYPLTDRVNLKPPNASGQGYTFWLKARDQAENQLIDYVFIRTDLTPPNFNNGEITFNKNVKGPERGYFSSVDINVTDSEGGIQHINFTLLDVFQTDREPVIIHKSLQLGQRSEQSQCDEEESRFCTNIGECYCKTQRVFINNCWFLEYMEVPARFIGDVVNRARLSTPVSLDLGEIIDLSGIGEYPSVEGIRLKKAFGYSVVLGWYLPNACYNITGVYIELEGAYGGNGGQAPLSAKATESELKDLVPYADYTANIYLLYQGRRKSAVVQFAFNTGEAPKPPGLSAAAIVGIVFGATVFLTIVGFIACILVRVYQHKPAVPERVRYSMRKQLSMFHDQIAHEVQDIPPSYNEAMQATFNVAYNAEPKLHDFEDDIYTYGEMETDPAAKWKHGDDKVTIGKTINTGRFAIIKEAVLHDTKTVRKVAAKIVKFKNEENDLLLKAKMNFMATVVPNHNNIVNFAGAIIDGPILLLEYCDHSLKDWLKSLTKISDDAEDNMVNFATDIARGMKHLHENGIIHRRLGARNVLLKNVPVMGRLVAKVTGFGPMKGETAGGGVESEKERIPIKWMALEQLGIEPGETRTYNEKTDVWSYGITIWEIFSKGVSPWNKVKSTEVAIQLEKGDRPECPEYSNEDLYNDVMYKCWDRKPDARPSFAIITDSLEKMFHGAADGDEYYDDSTTAAWAADDLYDETLPPEKTDPEMA